MTPPKFNIEYAVHQKGKEVTISKQEVEANSHECAAWKLQQEVKNELDPTGRLGVNVIMNLNK